MKNEADALGFPIIILPFGRSLSNIISAVTDKIHGYDDSQQMRELLTMQQRLAAAHSSSNGMREIARLATAYLKNAVLIVDSAWQLIAWEDCPQNPFPLYKALTLKKNYACFPESFCEEMPTTFETFRKPIVRQLTLENGQQIICRIFPVTADNSMIYGYVVVWETAKTLDGFDNIVLEHIAVNVAAERVLAREKDEAKTRVKRDFYFDLITGNIESIHAIKSMATLHGLPVDSAYRCISVQFLIKYDLITPDFTKLSSEIAERISRMCDVFISCISVSDGMIILYSTHESGEQEIDTLHSFINRFKDEFAARMQAEVRIVVSELVEDITQISNAYKCVCRLHELKYGIPSSDVLFVENYPVHFLIGDNVDSMTIKNFVQKSIGVLIEHDKKYNVNLVETMNTYFLCARNISETAKKMFIHRNTCIYRIDKIKCLLDDDFSDSNSLLKYQIALICLSLMNSEDY